MRALPPVVVAIALLGTVHGAAAQQPPPDSARGAVRLSLAQALSLAQERNPAIALANGTVEQARGLRQQARSQLFPQISGTANYTRTLRSQFQGLSFGESGVDTTASSLPALCAPTIPDNATPEQRAAALAAATTCPSSGFDLSQAGFGAANQWSLGLNASQSLFTGGRISGQLKATGAQLEAADIGLASQRAQTAFDVTQAYYDAVLAERLAAIADSSVQQTELVFQQTSTAYRVGNASEFDMLQAQVTRNNQTPVQIQARGNRDIAYLRLKQLLGMALDDSVVLTTAIEDSSATAALPASVTTSTPDTAGETRAPVRQAEAQVRAQEGLLRATEAERWPSIAVTMAYQRLYFPSTVFNFSRPRDNWTVGVGASISLFSGFRVTGDIAAARAALAQARARAEQARQFAALDTRVALNALSQARAAFTASAGTTQQAQRAYAINQIRFREGMSTQTDLSQSRLLLEQAEVNRAQAARDLAVARVRLALLRDIPFATTGTSGTASTTGTTTVVPSQPQTQGAPETGQPVPVTRAAGSSATFSAPSARVGP